MNTTNETPNSNISVAQTYYQAMLTKDFTALAACLHPDVHIISPLDKVSGKEAVLEAARNLTKLLIDIEFRANFSADKQIMMAYDFVFPEPIGKLRAAVLMDFEHHQISKIELFYDGSPFAALKDQIFSQN